MDGAAKDPCPTSHCVSAIFSGMTSNLFSRPIPPHTIGIRIWHALVIALLLSIFFNDARAETFNKLELEAVILYKIMQLTRWPDDGDGDKLNIGIYDSSPYLTTFRKIFKQQKIRGKALNIFRFNPYKDKNKDNLHILFITKNNTHKLKEINKRLKGQHVLIITDQSNEKRHVMVNLPFKSKSKISFEINRANILLEGINISNDIVLMGGSELDIAKIYQDTVSDLNKSKDIISKKDQELVKQQKELASKDLELENLILEITKQKQQLIKQNEKILKGNTLLQENSRSLQEIGSQLQGNKATLEKQNQENRQLLIEISNNKLTLIKQTTFLKEKDDQIKKREVEISISHETVSKHESTIKTQKNLLVFFMVQIFLVAALITVLYRSFLAKKKTSIMMQQKNKQLENTMDSLKSTQNKLIESEKMVSLGGMVKGIAHEINTPAGIVLTASSSLLKKTEDIEKEFKKGNITETVFLKYLKYSKETTHLTVNNINRLSELVKNFKLVAVDQYSNQQRTFELIEYIQEVIASLLPTLHGSGHNLNMVYAEKIELNSYPGAFSQIISLLVDNSIMHAFSATQSGVMEINISQKNSTLHFTYSDNGTTANQKTLDNIFEPFYTTTRSNRTGLGGHILYNLVTQLLKGSIHCYLSHSGGLAFEITLPIQKHQNRPS